MGLCVGCTSDAPDSAAGPAGASFVDAKLKVIVKQAQGTATAFQPEEPHGTTEALGTTCRGLTFAFSQRVTNMWNSPDGKVFRAKVCSSAGAGEGNPDA